MDLGEFVSLNEHCTSRWQEIRSSCHFVAATQSLLLRDNFVFGLTRAPQKEGDADGRQGHDGKSQPVQLKMKR